MGRFGDYWASQCGKPRGFIGKIVVSNYLSVRKSWHI